MIFSTGRAGLKPQTGAWRLTRSRQRYQAERGHALMVARVREAEAKEGLTLRYSEDGNGPEIVN